MTGSGDNLIDIANIVIVQYQEQAYRPTPSLTHIRVGDNGRRLPA